ncbi:MAG: glycosyltransferase family 4 protein [Saccharofermentanales bacterium]|jgi:glycosyltransferase involved in cell wall biosynthesis
MTITIFTGSLSGGGAERVATNLANFLSQRGHDVELLTVGDRKSIEKLTQQVRTTFLKAGASSHNRLINRIQRLLALKKHLKEHDRDCYISLLSVPSMMLLILRRFTKAAIIVSQRVDPSSQAKWIQIANRCLAERADGYVFQTETARKWFLPSIKTIRHAVIPNAINPVFLREPYTGERDKEIVSVGRLTEQKNFPLLIKAFSQIATEFPEYRLTIYGDGPLRHHLQQLILEHGLKDRVHLRGFVTEIEKRLETASMFVLASDYEGMPNALMEAMALGLPCVSTDCSGGGAKFLIDSGKNGLLVPVGDVQSMVEAMRTLLCAPQMAYNYGVEASKIRMRLSADEIYGQWELFALKVSKCKKVFESS